MAQTVIWSRCFRFVIFVALELDRLRNKMSATVLSMPIICRISSSNFSISDFQRATLLEVRLRLTCDGTRAENKFRLSAKRTSLFKRAGASVQSTTGSRGVRISGSNAGYTKFRCSVKGTGYPLHSPVFPSLPLPCVTVYHHVSTELYYAFLQNKLGIYGPCLEWHYGRTASTIAMSSSSQAVYLWSAGVRIC